MAERQCGNGTPRQILRGAEVREKLEDAEPQEDHDDCGSRHLNDLSRQPAQEARFRCVTMRKIDQCYLSRPPSGSTCESFASGHSGTLPCAICENELTFVRMSLLWEIILAPKNCSRHFLLGKEFRKQFPWSFWRAAS